MPNLDISLSGSLLFLDMALLLAPKFHPQPYGAMAVMGDNHRKGYAVGKTKKFRIGESNPGLHGESVM